MELLDEGGFERHLKPYVKRYPFISLAFRQILWNVPEESPREVAYKGLVAIDSPGAYQEIRDFATSQIGSDDQRMRALQVLTDAGQLDPEEAVRFWRAAEERWSEIKVFGQYISDEFKEFDCDPEAMGLFKQSLDLMGEDESGDIEKAIELLEQAVEIDPDCPVVLHNLGVYFMRMGKDELGSSMFHRAVEADPEYLYGYTSLANHALYEGDFEEVREYLDPVLTAPSVSAHTLIRALSIQTRLAFWEDELEIAESIIDRIEAIAPNHPVIDELSADLEEIQFNQRVHQRWLKDMHRYRRRLLNKPISRQEQLAVCLDRVSKERLVGTLRTWELKTSGRKAEVVSRLVAAITDSHALERMVADELNATERQALAWVLEGEGVRAWEEFTQRFGDDFDESPWWQWHEPNTVPGRLRMLGFLSVGTLDDQHVALIPKELRSLLQRFVGVDRS